jgi:predicted dienelactone hydrolase
MRPFRLTLIPLITVMILVAALVVLVKPSAAQGTTVLPLTEPGPYAVGFRLMNFVDASRDGRKIEAAIWYPAIQPENPDKSLMASFPPDKWGWLKAKPDLKGAPYPLILYSPRGYNPFAIPSAPGTNLESMSYPLNLPLTSHGFVVVGLSHPQDESQLSLVNRPLDISFVIDQLAAITTGDLAGLIDVNRVGVMGTDQGAYAALTVTGARIDPASVQAWLSKPAVAGDYGDPRNVFKDWNWDDLAAYRAKLSR